MDLTVTTNQKRKPVTVIHKLKRRSMFRDKPEFSYGQELISELLPLRNVMTYQLNKRGYNTKNIPFRDIVSLYYNEFTSNKENKSNYFEPINCYEFRNHAAFSIKPSDSINGNLKTFRNENYFSELSTVVDNIVKQFQNSYVKKQLANKDNFDSVETVILNNDEKLQATAVEKVNKKIENDYFLSQPITKKEIHTTLFIAGIIFLIYYLCGN
jgi:hypothetical protein